MRAFTLACSLLVHHCHEQKTIIQNPLPFKFPTLKFPSVVIPFRTVPYLDINRLVVSYYPLVNIDWFQTIFDFLSCAKPYCLVVRLPQTANLSQPGVGSDKVTWEISGSNIYSRNLSDPYSMRIRLNLFHQAIPR